MSFWGSFYIVKEGGAREQYFNHLEGLWGWERCVEGLTPEFPGWGARIHISSQFPDAAAAVGLGIPL